MRKWDTLRGVELLRRFVVRSTKECDRSVSSFQGNAAKKPLRFRYLYTGGRRAEIELAEWKEIGAYVEGVPTGSKQPERFMKMRMWEWRDSSYKQLEKYAPRRGAPVD